MPDFLWIQAPPYGVCFGCGTSSVDRGLVQTFADVDVRRDGEVVGVADVHFCANCVFAMGKLVGMATPQETEDFARRELEFLNESEKLKDEISAWQQRFTSLANLDLTDFADLAKLESERKNVPDV